MDMGKARTVSRPWTCDYCCEVLRLEQDGTRLARRIEGLPEILSGQISKQSLECFFCLKCFILLAEL